MEKFELTTSVWFGTDALNCLTELSGAKILIITDPYMVQSKMIERVTEKLAGREYRVFDRVEPDPSLELIVEGIRAVMEYRPDCLIALGGGSAIDEAKAVLHFSRRIGKLPDMELIAVPTTSGTGSEVTSFAVVTDKAKGIKYPLVDKSLLPAAAVLDPSLVRSLPPSLAADTGMDVLTHALEAYVSDRADAFSDALAEKAVTAVFKYLPRSYRDPEDQEAREQMHYASCMAGMAFDRASLGASHAIAHNIGGKFHIPHGRTNAVLLPFVVEYNADIREYNPKKYTKAAQKYAEAARLAGFGGSTVRSGVKNLAAHIRKLQEQMKLPGSFKACGIQEKEYRRMEDEVAAGALADGCMASNPRHMNREDVLMILKQAYAGVHGTSMAQPLE